jgi:uncharacterized protein DUF3892
MTVYITAVQPSSAQRHEHITRVWWLDSGNSTSKQMSTAQAVEWIRDGNRLFVAGVDAAAEVRVVDTTPPYLRTVADGKWSDNLLALPRF